MDHRQLLTRHYDTDGAYRMGNCLRRPRQIGEAGGLCKQMNITKSYSFAIKKVFNYVFYLRR